MTTWPRLIITDDGNTWLPERGLKTFDVSERNNGEPATTQLQVAAYDDGLVTPADVIDKLFEGATVWMYLVDVANPANRAFEFYGRIGTWNWPALDVVTFVITNPHGKPRYNLVPVFSVMCRFGFGDRFCGVPVMRPAVARSTHYAVGDCTRYCAPGAAPEGFGNVYFETTTAGTTAASAPSYNYTVGATTTDGSAVLTARNAFERHCEIASVTDRHNMKLTASPDPRAVTNWYAPGKIQFATGRLKNQTYKVGGWRASDLQLTTFQPVGLYAALGDKALIWPDCSKTLDNCVTPYANGRRYGGFRYYEGAQAVSLDTST